MRLLWKKTNVEIQNVSATSTNVKPLNTNNMINTCITKITIITVINLYTVNGKHITIKAFCTNHTNVHSIVMCERRWVCGYFYNTCICATQLNACIFCWEMYIKQYMVFKKNQTHCTLFMMMLPTQKYRTSDEQNKCNFFWNHPKHISVSND